MSTLVNPSTLRARHLYPRRQNQLARFVALEQNLEELLHRNVDLVSKKTVVQDRNWLRRKEILNHYQVIYESRSVLPA